MVETMPPIVWIAGGALLALVVFIGVWRLAGGLPNWLRAAVQLILIGVVLAPLAVLYLGLGDEPAGSAVRDAAPSEIASDDQERPEGRAPSTGFGSGSGSSSGEGYRAPTSGHKSGSKPGSGFSDRRVVQPKAYKRADAPVKNATKAPPTVGARTRGVLEDSAGADSGVGIQKDEWTLVPVFYGTDRELKTSNDRIGYTWKRARRLEIGRAIVSVPKDHVEPRVERPWALTIPYTNIKLYEAAEDPAEHFTIQEIKALSKEDFLSFVRERIAASERFKDHALIFVHGYQTTFDNAVFRTAQITFDLKFDGAPFLYSWPSGGTIQGYTYDRESAAQAEPHLREFLDLVVNQSGAKKVSVIAHSMGNQPLLRVLQGLKRSLPEGLQLSQLILAAPDVDRDSFKNIVRSIGGVAQGITLYAAANDKALGLSRRVNGGEPRAGEVPASGPVVMDGVDTIDATAASMDTLGINHAGYAENLKLLRDIGRLIETGERPPLKRVPELEVIPVDNGVYWRFPAAP